jgi:hypothetical protein
MNSIYHSATSSATANTQSFNKKTGDANSGSLGFKNVLILFFSAMAISLVVLLLFFGVFFQKIDFSLNTKPLQTVQTTISPQAANNQSDVAATPLSPTQLDDVFNEININVPTDAYKTASPSSVATGGSTTLETPTKTKKKNAVATDAYVGVGAAANDTEYDTSVEQAPPPVLKPHVNNSINNKTAPIAQSNESSSSESSSSSSSEPDLMPMAPLPGQ